MHAHKRALGKSFSTYTLSKTTIEANVYAVQYIKGIFAWFEMGSIIEIFIGWKTYRNTILYKTKLKKEEVSSSLTSYVFLL